MSGLPNTNASLLVRTSFSDDGSWVKLLHELAQESVDGFRAYVEVVDDPRWDRATAEVLRTSASHSSAAAVLFVADHVTLATSDHPVVVVDLWGDHAHFRCVSSELWAPENNLNIGNMDFLEFANAVGQDGVYRGFPGPTPSGATKR